MRQTVRPSSTCYLPRTATAPISKLAETLKPIPFPKRRGQRDPVGEETFRNMIRLIDSRRTVENPEAAASACVSAW